MPKKQVAFLSGFTYAGTHPYVCQNQRHWFCQAPDPNFLRTALGKIPFCLEMKLCNRQKTDSSGGKAPNNECIKSKQTANGENPKHSLQTLIDAVMYVFARVVWQGCKSLSIWALKNRYSSFSRSAAAAQHFCLPCSKIPHACRDWHCGKNHALVVLNCCSQDLRVVNEPCSLPVLPLCCGKEQKTMQNNFLIFFSCWKEKHLTLTARWPDSFIHISGVFFRILNDYSRANIYRVSLGVPLDHRTLLGQKKTKTLGNEHWYCLSQSWEQNTWPNFSDHFESFSDEMIHACPLSFHCMCF